ncbi:hypothetical protein, partial [Laspinema olomoucense]|uniref:hypothetical protein n=1 Tax=Laspinema olomoucense TaxID=3231600 RepID=UPI0021BB6511
GGNDFSRDVEQGITTCCQSPLSPLSPVSPPTSPSPHLPYLPPLPHFPSALIPFNQSEYLL